MVSFHTDGDPDQLGLDRTASAALLGICAVVGGVVLTLGPRSARWVLELPWVPFEGPVRLLRALDAQLAWPLMAVIGVALGVVVGLMLRRQAVVVSVGGREILVTEGSKRQRVARVQADRVLVSGKRLTIRDQRDVDLVDVTTEVSAATLTTALTRHGWPVSERD